MTVLSYEKWWKLVPLVLPNTLTHTHTVMHVILACLTFRFAAAWQLSPPGLTVWVFNVQKECSLLTPRLWWLMIYGQLINKSCYWYVSERQTKTACRCNYFSACSALLECCKYRSCTVDNKSIKIIVGSPSCVVLTFEHCHLISRKLTHCTVSFFSFIQFSVEV